MLHRFPGEFVCRADPSLGFGAWLDRLGVTAVFVDNVLVPLKLVTFTEVQTTFAGDRLHIIGTAHPISIARLPRTLRERNYTLATPRQYCRFLEIADAFGQWMHLPFSRLLLPRPWLTLCVDAGGTPTTNAPAALLIELKNGFPHMVFFTKPRAMPMLDCSTRVLACPNGYGASLYP